MIQFKVHIKNKLAKWQEQINNMTMCQVWHIVRINDKVDKLTGKKEGENKYLRKMYLNDKNETSYTTNTNPKQH